MLFGGNTSRGQKQKKRCSSEDGGRDAGYPTTGTGAKEQSYMQLLQNRFHNQLLYQAALAGDGAVVKARTGFVSIFSLLSFVVVLCDGDLVQMMEKETSMTWFEEWFLYFQWEWGREST
jgi:hypothetical protein